MILRLSRTCIFLLLVLVLAWALPSLYDIAMLKPINKTHVFYSPTLKKFIYTEQIRGYDEEASAKSEGHHTDIVYKDEDGTYYDRFAFEAALPFVYFRNMEMRGLLPLKLEGREFGRKDIEKARRVLELKARNLDGQRPERPLLPLIEADPGQAALLYPTDRFRLADSRLEFVNADINKVDEEQSRLFSSALEEKGFRFPVRHVGGNFTTFKPYEGGLFLVDSFGGLFHLIRRKGQPEVSSVPLPAGIVPRHVLVSESRERGWPGLMVDEAQGMWLIRQHDMALVPLEVPGYTPMKMDAKLLFDPLYLTVTISDEARIHATVYRLPGDQGTEGSRFESVKPFRSFSHEMSRARVSWQGSVADTLFPFRLGFEGEARTYLVPELRFSSSWLTHALPFGLLLAILYGVLFRRGKRSSSEHCGVMALIAGTGLFGLIAVLILREPD